MTIKALASGFEVRPLVDQIDAHPEVWNTHTMRTQQYVHSDVSDIWIRYNDWANFHGDPAAFNDRHEAVWYPVCDVLTQVQPLVDRVMKHVGGMELGGVLITRIPPGSGVAPHIDGGWHAGYYEKFALQLKGNQDQAFCFDDAQLRPEPGDLYTFDNSKRHWVTNDSDSDRMTLIICIRGTQCLLTTN